MKDDLRKSGIEMVGDVPWGVHICQFYQNREDLIEILVPYFKQGLENNEFCLWVTSEPLGAEDAKSVLREKVGNLDDYINKGQIEILDASQLYLRPSGFDAGPVLKEWFEKEKKAIEKGFDGLRITGNASWLDKKNWQDFVDYETAISSIIGGRRMLAICSYPLVQCQIADTIDIVNNHQATLIKKEGRWAYLKSSVRKRVEEIVQQWNKTFDAMSDSICLMDPDGRILKHNKSTERLLDKSADEIDGHFCYEVFHSTAQPPQECPRKGAQEARCMRSEVVQRGQKWLDIIVDPILDKAGRVEAVVHIAQDITERKQAEETLRENEARFRMLVESSPFAMIILKGVEQQQVEFVNKKFTEIFGYDVADIPYADIAQWWLRAYPDEQYRKGIHVQWAERVKMALEHQGASDPLITKVTCKDGSHRYAEFKFVPAGRKNVVFCSDITERKEVEEKLRNSEKRYREFFATSRDCVFITSKDGKWIDFNDAALEMFGCTSWEELIQIPIPSLYVDPEDRLRLLAIIQKQGYVNEYPVRLKKKDGTVFDALITSGFRKKTDDDAWEFYGTIRDITERKRAEETLEFNNIILRTQQESSIDGILVVDENGKILSANRRFVDMWSIPPAAMESKSDELVMQTVMDKLVNPEEFIRKVKHLYEVRDEICRDEIALKDGRSFDRYTAPMAGDGGKYYGRVWYFRDITESKRSEEALRDYAVRLSYLTKYANDFIILLDENFRFVEFNERMSDFYGYSKEELLSMSAIQVRAPETESNFAEQIAQVQINDKALYETVHRRKDGSTFPVEINLRTINIDGKRYYQAIVRDITERKKAEENLRQSEEKYRSIVDNIGIGVALISPEMEILSLNNQMRKWNQHIDLKTRPICYRAFNNPPRDAKCSYCPTAKTLEDGLVHEAVTETPMDGQVINYRVVSSPIKDETGKIVAAIEMVENITERKKLEEEVRKRLQELEVFYKASIGREERILELKWEIEKMKKELKDKE